MKHGREVRLRWSVGCKATEVTKHQVGAAMVDADRVRCPGGTRCPEDGVGIRRWETRGYRMSILSYSLGACRSELGSSKEGVEDLSIRCSFSGRDGAVGAL